MPLTDFSKIFYTNNKILYSYSKIDNLIIVLRNFSGNLKHI